MITDMPTSTMEEGKRLGKASWRGAQRRFWLLSVARGAASAGRSLRLFPAVKVSPKDTTGAGDAFTAASVYYALTGDIAQAVKIANHYAALSSTLNTGTQKAFYSREEFDRARAGLAKE